MSDAIGNATARSIYALSDVAAFLRPPSIPIGPYVAEVVRKGLLADPERLLADVSYVKSDLHPELGYLVSLTKIIEVSDRIGNRYRVTVEVLDREKP